MNFSVFVSCPKSLEYLLEAELKALGLNVSRVTPQGVFGEANLTLIYRICLWSRIANRVLLILFSGQAHNEQTLRNLCSQFPWQTLFSTEKTFSIAFHGTSDHLKNEMFSAQVVKDAIVDHFRKLQGIRPSVSKDNPDILIHAHLKQGELTVSFDLNGFSLHERGYRAKQGPAPLKENLAAALLIRANWPALAEKGYTLLDPFCGSGTFIIEAALMAANIAPGIYRTERAFCHWIHHQKALWEKIKANALSQVKPIKLTLIGSDKDRKQIEMAEENARKAGVLQLVKFSKLSIEEVKPPHTRGLLICNPPYGERLEDPLPLIPLYQSLGKQLHEHFQGWHAFILTANPLLAKAMGLRSHKQFTVYNGPIECKLYEFLVSSSNRLKDMSSELSGSAKMFSNRLEKNYKHLQKWAKRNEIECYRVYDADLPDYAFAIDLYQDYIVLQEYKAPVEIPQYKTEIRHLEVVQIVPKVLEIAPSHLVVKQRKQQKGKEQYHKLGHFNKTMIVQEGRAKFKVNLQDYLDTGLFLDHR